MTNCIELNWKPTPNIYKHLGKSIYTQNCCISSDQILFLKKLPSSVSVNKSRTAKKITTKCKKKSHCPKNLSHSDIIEIQKINAYYNPQAFTKR